MRILLSSYGCAPDTGSESGVGWAWATGLAREGYDVTVMTTSRDAEAIKSWTATVRPENLRFEFVDDPLWGSRVPGQAGVGVRYLAWQRACYVRAKALAETEPFDIAHHVSWGSIQLGSWLGMLNIPFVFGPVGGGQTFPSALRRYYVGRYIDEWIRTFLTRNGLRVSPFTLAPLRQAASVLVNNSDTAALARRLGAGRVEYVSELFIDSIAAPPPRRKPHASLNLLWVGRLLPRKGLPLALDAISRVPEDVEVQLRIAGDGPQLSWAVDTVRHGALGERVSLLGRVPHGEMSELYRWSDALLFTSLRDTTGAQLLEAATYGNAIIALDHHGAHDLVPGAAGIKVPVGTADETVTGVRDAIIALYEDRRALRRMQDEAYEFARHLTWSRTAAQVKRIYAEATSA